jgi:hypothetical protein
MTNYFKVTRALPGDSLSAKIQAAGGAGTGDLVAKRGQMVQIDPATVVGQPSVFDTDVAWKLANGTRGFHLERNVVVGPIPLDQIAFNIDFNIPDLCNPDTKIGYASARKVQEFEIEGPDMIDVSLDGSTAAGTAVTSKAGKVSLKGTSDELYGYLRGQLAKQDSTNTCRLLIEVVE